MANLTELSQWEAGIYQLETTDPVEAGSGGIANEQARLLGNRTKYLYDKLIPINKGYISGLDVGAISPVLSYSGNVSSISYVRLSADDSEITVNIPNSMGGTNYIVKMYVESRSSSVSSDNDICVPVFKVISGTQFKIGIRQVSDDVQNLRIHFETFLI